VILTAAQCGIINRHTADILVRVTNC